MPSGAQDTRFSCEEFAAARGRMPRGRLDFCATRVRVVTENAPSESLAFRHTIADFLLRLTTRDLNLYFTIWLNNLPVKRNERPIERDLRRPRRSYASRHLGEIGHGRDFGERAGGAFSHEPTGRHQTLERVGASGTDCKGPRRAVAPVPIASCPASRGVLVDRRVSRTLGAKARSSQLLLATIGS